MNKLKEVVDYEIDDILKSGISYKNVSVLGKLVDILKDIEQIHTMRRGMYESKDVDTMIEKLRNRDKDDLNTNMIMLKKIISEASSALDYLESKYK